MTQPVWVLHNVTIAVHQMLLGKHGGGVGLRDEDLLASALSRPKQIFAYDAEVTLFDLASAYSYGIARNHPFVDGNKRTTFTIGALFLELNGYQLTATEVDAAILFQQLAAGEIEEDALSSWFQNNNSEI